MNLYSLAAYSLFCLSSSLFTFSHSPPRHYPPRPISPRSVFCHFASVNTQSDWCFRTSSLIAATSPWDTTKPICLSRRVRQRTQPTHFRSFAGHRNRTLLPHILLVHLIPLSSRRTSYTTKSKRTAACTDGVSARSRRRLIFSRQDRDFSLRNCVIIRR